MTQYNLQGSAVRLYNDLDLNIVQELPVDMYTVSFHPMQGYWLTRMPHFDLPSKIYGDANDMSSRILNTFKDREGSTGALLSGVKGSGKSLTMKLTALKALKEGFPVVVVNAAYCGQQFNEFIAALDQPIVLIFDEFEKVYDSNAQNELLTLFDGVYTSKKLFMLTANDTFRISQYMTNRPGRIYYNIEYKGLTAEFITEFCNDVLKDKSHVDDILRYAATFSDFNFDMLKAICEELNRYGEKVKDLLRVLNIRHDGSSPIYDLRLFHKGKELDARLHISRGTHQLQLLSDDEFYIEYSLDSAKNEDGSSVAYHRRVWNEATLEPMAEDVERDQNLTTFKFNLGDDVVIVAEKGKEQVSHIYRMFG